MPFQSKLSKGYLQYVQIEATNPYPKVLADIIEEDDQMQTLLLNQQKIEKQIKESKNQKIVDSSSSKSKQIV